MTPLRTEALLVIALFLTSCGGQELPQVVVYSPHGKEMLAEYRRSFETAHPGIACVTLDMGSQDAFDRIRTERNNPQADIWWGAPAGLFMRAERESLLQVYRPSWDSAAAPERRSAHGFWYATFLTPEVILYNSRVLTAEDVPDDWDGLLDPRWKDKIIIRNPPASGTMRTIFCALIDRERRRTGRLQDGFDWLLRLDANTKLYALDPTQLYLKIAREEGVLSLWNLPDVVIQSRINSYPFGYVLPRSGTPLTTDCIAIVRGARNKEAARLFYEHVTSADVLLHQAERFYRIPARTDLDRNLLPAWIRTQTIPEMPVDWDTLFANETAWMARWDAEVRGRGAGWLKSMPESPGADWRSPWQR